MTPTSRTLAALRKLGFTAQVVERWNSHAKVRVDLFGCIDVLAVEAVGGILGVQACSAASMSARRAKAEAEPRLLTWGAAGGRFEIWAWKGSLLRRDVLSRHGGAWRWQEHDYCTVADLIAMAAA